MMLTPDVECKREKGYQINISLAFNTAIQKFMYFWYYLIHFKVIKIKVPKICVYSVSSLEATQSWLTFVT